MSHSNTTKAMLYTIMNMSRYRKPILTEH